MTIDDTDKAVPRSLLVVGGALSRSAAQGMLRTVATVNDALAAGEADIVVLDLRERDAKATDFRRLRTKLPRAFLLGIVDRLAPLAVRWEAAKAGCDDFITVSAAGDDASPKLLATLAATEIARPRVLVVDDEENNRELLRQELGDANFDVVLAEDGLEALARAAASVLDIVLLDIMMPGMDGREVCRRLRADAKTKDVPIVMLSALDQIRDKLQALDMGANDYVTKPYDAEALILKLRQLLWLRSAHRQLDRALARR